MIKNTTVMVRPSTEKDFWGFAPIVQEYVNAAYVNTGKLTFGTVSLSDDELTRTRTVLWKDQASLEEYIADEIVKQAYKERKAYCTEHNHTFSSSNTVLENA